MTKQPRRQHPFLPLFRIGAVFVLLFIVQWNLAVHEARAAESNADSGRANVLLIVIDDLNDWVGFLSGHPQVKTPNMDRLAERGIVFTNAHCAAPLCCPSRAALFGGRQPYHTGVYRNDHDIRKMHPDLVLLPQAFSKAGYRTLGAGKLLHRRSAGIFDEYFRTEQRWSPFEGKNAVAPKERGLDEQGVPRRYSVRLGTQTLHLPLNGLRSDRGKQRVAESFDWGPFDVDDAAMGDSRVAEWAIDKLA